MKTKLKKIISGITYSGVKKALLFVVAIVLVMLMLPRQQKFKYDYFLGKPWKYDDFYAIEDIAILKPESELEKEKQKVAEESLPYYVRNSHIQDSVKIELKNYLSHIDTSSILSKKKSRYLNRNKERLLLLGSRLLDSVYNKGIILLNENASENLSDENADKIMLILGNNKVQEHNKNDFHNIVSANKFFISSLDKHPEEASKLLMPILQRLLTYNINFSQSYTQLHYDQNISRISLTRGVIQKGERVVARGEIVNQNKFLALETIRLNYESQQVDKKHYNNTLIGQLILVCIAFTTIALYLFTFNNKLFNSDKSVGLLLLLILLVVGMVILSLKLAPEYLLIVPIPVVPIMIRLFFNSKTAIFVHVFVMVIISFIVPNNIIFLFTELVVGVVAIISIASLERRSQLFVTSLIIFISYSLIYTGFYLIQEGTLQGINFVSYIVLFASSLLTMLVYPLLFLFEKLFRITTNITYFELTDTNNPILRELSLKAPGTFQHSLMVSNMVEEACIAIGANSLLGRVGALYHDIGKIDNPQFFIENQSSGYNPHDDIEYTESAKIIVGHVIKGVEKAKAQKLPNEVIDFIRTHHGTRYAQYFYNKYKIANPDKEPDEKIFRYHGPIPQTKETSILMIVDPIEAASRTLKTPSEQNIVELIESVVKTLIDAKQFDNSELTLQEIDKVKKTIKSRLMSIYHVRIEYPVVK
ncbi:MAG: HD family phosphohydrolase [Bacteroidales bacterium]|jgi:putative nucleotidyltransferase with HDIG domain